nr:histidine kinase N-terminal 7TM domain-containing protein [Pedobacter xinjiangensis]
MFFFGIAAFVISTFLFIRIRDIGKYLSFVILSAALWAIMYAVELLQVELERAYTIVEIEYIGITLLPTFWLIFIVKFLRLHQYINLRNFLLLLLFPLLTIIIVWTNEKHHFHYSDVQLNQNDYYSVFTFTPGPWYIVFTIWFYATLAFGLFLLVINRSKENNLFRKQKNALILASTIPWLANILYLIGFRLDEGIDITPFSFIISTSFFSYALIKYQLLDIRPVASEQIIQALREGVLVSDIGNRIIDLNPEMSAILNADNKNFIGANLDKFFPELKHSEFTGEMEIVLQSETGEKTYSVTISNLNDKKGNAIGRIFLFKDISYLKATEKVLLKAREAAEQATAAKDQFLSTMSHEIRTPMNSILGFTHLLLQNDPREDQKEYLNVQKFAAENLMVLINDILDFAKIEAGKIDVEEMSINLNQLAQKIFSTFKSAAGEKGIKLELNLPAEGIPMVLGDPFRITQILTNLISNAIKFTQEGVVSVNITPGKQTLESIAVLFEVTDTGIGIAEDKIHVIFESFTQASSDTTRKFGGTGLGLTICKRLLELMNSEMHVKSIPGRGSSFSFELLFKLVMVAPEEKQDQEEDSVPKDLTGRKILVVDDNPMNVLLASQFLKRWNIQVGVARNGLEALKEVQWNDYDLVLMDLEMPEMDGYTASREIRLLPDPKFQHLPIVALSANAMADVQERVLAAGMKDFLSKPFTPQSLYDKVSAGFR